MARSRMSRGFAIKSAAINTGTAASAHFFQNQIRYTPPQSVPSHMLRVQVSPRAAPPEPQLQPTTRTPLRSLAKNTSAAITRSAIINSPLNVIQWPMNPVMREST